MALVQPLATLHCEELNPPSANEISNFYRQCRATLSLWGSACGADLSELHRKG